MTDFKSYMDKYNKIILVKNKLMLINSADAFAHNIEQNEVIFEEISDTMSEQLSRLYRMYEFTDKFIIIPDGNTYPSIFNFIGNELLTEEEVWKALFM